MPLIQALEKQRRVDLCDFQAGLFYMLRCCLKEGEERRKRKRRRRKKKKRRRRGKRKKEEVREPLRKILDLILWLAYSYTTYMNMNPHRQV